MSPCSSCYPQLPSFRTRITTCCGSLSQAFVAAFSPGRTGEAGGGPYEVRVEAAEACAAAAKKARCTLEATGLLNGVAQSVTLRAFAGDKLGGYASAPARATPATLPEPPLLISARAAFDGTLRAAWLPPTDDGGLPILGYDHCRQLVRTRIATCYP